MRTIIILETLFDWDYFLYTSNFDYVGNFMISFVCTLHVLNIQLSQLSCVSAAGNHEQNSQGIHHEPGL